jgi:ankyrin repeat protein
LLAQWKPKEQLEYARTLVEAGANVNLTTIQNATSIFVAAQFNNMELLKYLKSVGANPSVRLTDGSTCLLVASER